MVAARKTLQLLRLSKTCNYFCCRQFQCKKSIHLQKCLPKLSLNHTDLDLIEKNLTLRQCPNNVPQIRTLIKELGDNGENVELQQRLQTELDKLPNLTHPRVVSYGNEPRELLRHLKPTQEKTVEFSEVCKRMNLLRMDHLSNYTGHKSYYLIGALAELEHALVQYALSTLKMNNFNLMSVPDILPAAIISGCGMQLDGERTQVYKLDSSTNCLSGTSEMALAGFFADEIIDESDLPIKVSASSRCFRAETSGLHEEKGLYRVHQFTKVEMFALCTETQSEAMLETFKDIELDLYQKLELNFRLLDMPPYELGTQAYQKYDIEAWMPGRQMWGEISSCSNCTDYQAKRLSIRYRTKDKQLKYVHTVNGTAAAIPRLLIALIESNQDKENRIITIPKVLKSFMQRNEIRKEKRYPETKLVKFINATT